MTYQEAIAKLRSKMIKAIRQTRRLPASDMPILVRLETPLPSLNQLSWLMAQVDPVKIFWSTRDQSKSVAAIGTADDRMIPDCTALQDELSHIRAVLARTDEESTACYYGGVGFNDQESYSWRGFPYGRFVLPRIEIIREDEEYRLACNLLFQDPQSNPSASAGLQRCLDDLRLETVGACRPQWNHPILARRDSLTSSEWRAKVRRVLELETTGRLSKIVLSREVVLEFAEAVSPWRLLEKWQEFSVNCFNFAFHFNNQPSFLGCSPERLFKLSGLVLETEAVAGTIRRGMSDDEDARNEQRLKSDYKVIRENELVRDYISERLRPLCRTLTPDKVPSVLKLNQLQHLRYRLRGRLRQAFTAADILEALHPTPAVGGTPKNLSLDLIRELEPHSRGWYSGTVGYIGARDAEFAVAIRCALINGNTVKLYSGSGIVPGSQPDAEWHELESKISTALSLFG